jgi:aspartyl/asparaginyl-tRNA synthetase
MKREAEFLSDCEPALIYIARKLKESLEVEAMLTEAGFDYAVEPDRYRGGFIFQTERVGAFFYVRPEVARAAREFLSGKGFRAVEREA